MCEGREDVLSPVAIMFQVMIYLRVLTCDPVILVTVMLALALPLVYCKLVCVKIHPSCAAQVAQC